MPPSQTVTDDRGVAVALPAPPTRIVSLVPSTTETLFALGLGTAVIGTTRFCTAPPEARGRSRVGGTKDVDVERVLALQPDLVIGNAEENTREIFDALDGRVPLYVAFPRTVDDAVADLVRMGDLLHVPTRARALAAEIAAEIAAARAAAPTLDGARALTFIWRDPWMVAGADTFVSAVLGELGVACALPDGDARYPVLSAAEIGALDPDLLLLTSEPFPFKARHAAELCAATGLPASRVRFIDGSLCSWHGARLARAFRELPAQLSPPPGDSPEST